MRRIGLCVLAAAALAAASAAPASAAIWGPGCATALTAAGTSTSCGFDSPTDWSLVRVTPVGTVSVTVRCNNFGYTSTVSRTFSANGTWSVGTRGTCTLSIAPVTSGAAGEASATPWIPPIYDPPPPA